MTRLRRRMLAIAALAAAAVACVLTLTDVTRRLELSTVDSRFELRGEQPVPRRHRARRDRRQDVRPRRVRQGLPVLAQLPRRRHRAGQRAATRAVIVYDVQFTEPSDDRRRRQPPVPRRPAGGQRRVRARRRRCPTGPRTSSAASRPSRTRASPSATACFDEDPGGVIRRVQERDQRPRHARGRRVRRLGLPVDEARAATGDGQWIDYAGPAGHIPRYTFSDVGQGEVDPETFRDKIVVVGATAPVLQDIHPVSWPDDRMPGPEVHANAIATLLDGVPLRSTVEGVDLVLALALALLAPLAGLLRRAWLALAIIVAAGLLYVVAAQLLFDAGVDRPGRRAAGGARDGPRRHAARLLAQRHVRARAHARRVRPLRARRRRRPGAHARDGGGRPAPGRREDGRDGHVQRPARLHDVRGGAAARAGDRDPQPLPHGDERRDPRPRRHARGLHGRRDHGRVRRPGRGRTTTRTRRSPPRGRCSTGSPSSTPGCASASWATASRWASGCTPAR